MKLGVPVSKVTEALGAVLGGTYVNDFNRFGRQYKVYLQGEAIDRVKPENLNLIYVKNNAGAMLPISTLVTATKVTGPDFTNRLNLFRSAEIGEVQTTDTVVHKHWMRWKKWPRKPCPPT